MKKIVITGGSGRFGEVLKKYKTKHKLYFPTKKELNILSSIKIESYLKKIKPDILIHLAGLSRPMKIHDTKIHKSIDLNIIGTANITKACFKNNIKLIYFSTGYVYEGKKGNYKEKDPLLPINNYAWSKLGGECSVVLYKKSLILRIMMCERPFLHDHAFYDIKTNFMFQDEVARIIPKILDKRGIINIGGKIQSVYDFAKKTKKDVLKSSGKKIFPPNPSMNISKLKKILS